MKLPRPTVFLDRDGVVNFDSPFYIKNAEEFRFIPGSAEAIALLYQNGFEIIVITNQSMINRKISTMENLEVIFEKMAFGVQAKGGVIKDILYCPHGPDENCLCRKPKPGLLLAALQRYNIDPLTSYMVGDSVKDIECARNAFIGKAILVLTGNGAKALKTLSETREKPDFTARDLMAAARWIIQHRGLQTRP